MPQSVLEGLPVLGHVARHGFGTHGKVNASPLEREQGESENRQEFDIMNSLVSAGTFRKKRKKRHVRFASGFAY